MNEEIISILSLKDACGISFEYAKSLESFDKGWQESDKGIWMVGTVHFFKMCEYKDEILAVIKELTEEFCDSGRYLAQSKEVGERVKQRAKAFIAKNDPDCEVFLDAAYALAKVFVFVYVPVEIGDYEARKHVPLNEKTLAGIVRKRIPAITNADILRYDEFGSE